ncbi:acetyl-CoA carboxylase biotin carboxyl carrier protein [Methyloceanibacter sp.]|uniref:acetyl-CoA carboxylase biotin carboxyl carrier protein n=1 Tax=Methyloceanibacter sp. TaxID=1965321 RepID=UPI003D6C846F
MAEERKAVTKKEGTFDKDLIRELAGLLEETGLTEIEIEHEGKRVRVARTITVGAGALSIDAGHAAREAGERGGKEEHHRPGTVHSPMVGTAYRSPEPGAPPFVEAGTKVTAGQTILIIEAMKTMNHIPAPHAGTVLAVLVDDGQPVEFAEPLAVIEKG